MRREPLRIRGTWLGAVLSLMAGLPALAQPSLPMELPVSAKSVSGQFIVHGRGSALPAPNREVTRVGTNDIIVLRPDLLVVTAERVKRALERQLGATDQWRGGVHLQLREAARFSGPVSIQVQAYRDGWKYFAVVPDRVGWERLIRSLTEVVLLERANRENAGDDCAFLPLWLAGGLTELLLADEGRDLVTESGTLINRSQLKPDALRPVRIAFNGREPMSFSELSLTTLDQLSDPAVFAHFQASSALFTYELLRDEVGRAGMREFIRLLPTSLNWQTVFLRAFSARFSSLLDVEKWWAVASADTLAVESNQRWSRDRVLARLAELLVETAEVRPDTNSPAVRQNIPLREVLVTWDYATQRDVVRRKAGQIRALGMRAPPDVAQLVRDSAKVLDDYVSQRDGNASSTTTGRMQLEKRGKFVAEAAAKRLAAVEQRLAGERQRVPRVPTPPADPARVVAPPVIISPASGG